MKKTRLLALLLAVVMLVGVLAACSSSTPSNSTTETPANSTTETPAETPAENELPDEPTAPTTVSLPLVTEPVTLKFWWPSVSGMLTLGCDSAEDYLYFAEMEKRSGVHVEIEIPNDAQTQFGILMASEDYPDFIENFGMYYTSGLDHAIEEDLVVALEDYKEYLPNLYSILDTDIEVRRQVTTDNGHLPGIPFITPMRQQAWAGMMLRSDWLAESGMSMPTTYSELESFLAYVKQNHSDTAIPMMLSQINGNFLMNVGMAFMSGYNVTPDWMQIDGQVLYSPTQDGFRDYVKMLSDWYAAGYLDPDLMSKFSLWTSATEYTSEPFGVFPIIYTHRSGIVDAVTETFPEFEMAAIPALSVEKGGAIRTFYSVDKGSVNSVVMTSSENIELVCRWWDYFFSEEGKILANYGIEHETFEFDENGNPNWIVDYFTSDDPSWNLSNIQYKTVFYNSPGYVITTRESVMADADDMALMDVWNEGTEIDWCYPASATMTASEAEAYAGVMNDITTYVQEFTSKLLVGAESFDNYDKFIAEINQMGLQTAIDCKQAALERYLAR